MRSRRHRGNHPDTGGLPERPDAPIEEQIDDVWAGEDDPAELETELALRWIADLEEEEHERLPGAFAAVIVSCLVGAAFWMLFFYLLYRLVGS